MSVYEIVFGVILIAVSLFIIIFTLAQETKGQGLSAAIMGDDLNSQALVIQVCLLVQGNDMLVM